MLAFDNNNTYVFSCDRPQSIRSQKLVMLLVEHVGTMVAAQHFSSKGPTTLFFDRSWLSRSPTSLRSPSPQATFPTNKLNLSPKSFRRAAAPL